MRLKEVVITGMGSVSPLGLNTSGLIEGIENNKSAVEKMPDWAEYKGLRSLIAAPAKLANVKHIPRKKRRSMGRMSIFSVQASEEALSDSRIENDIITSGRLGCVIGSTMGGSESINDTFETMLPDKDLSQLTSMKFFQCISHTAAMNVAQFLGIKGSVLATCAACASALQAVGAGYDLIRTGQQDAVLCGGAEELHPIVTGSFDVLFATSSNYNDNPSESPRPFDADRDGLVCGEGAGIVLLEEKQRALNRGAKIYGEIIGYNTCGSGKHVSQSNAEGMRFCMDRALESAEIKPDEVDYINAHATATLQGDSAETKAIRDVFKDKVPVSSLKRYFGHTLGASGTIELIASLAMMQKGMIYPTYNLKKIAADCEGISHIKEKTEKDISILMKNCFAFGGINAALLCRKEKANG